MAWLTRWLFPREFSPGLRRAAVEKVLSPIPLRMQAQKLLGVEWSTVGAAKDAPHRHLLSRRGRRHLPIDRAGRVERDIPDRVRAADVIHRVRVVVGADGAG